MKQLIVAILIIGLGVSHLVAAEKASEKPANLDKVKVKGKKNSSMICKSYKPTGSHVSRRSCRSKQSAEAARDASQQNLLDITRHSDNMSVVNSNK